MDASSTTITLTHLLIAWTLFGVLFVWILLFAFLALRPEAREDVEMVEDTSYTISLTNTPSSLAHTSTAQPLPITTSVHAHVYETV